MKAYNSTVWAVFCWHLPPMITRYVEKPLRIFKVLIKISTQALVVECVFCWPEVIHSPNNILGYHVVWLFRLVAVSVCGRSGLWPFRSVAVPVCGRFGLWPFRFVAVSVCGRFGLWPLWPVTFSTIWFGRSTECRLHAVNYPYEQLFVKSFNDDCNKNSTPRTMDTMAMHTLSPITCHFSKECPHKTQTVTSHNISHSVFNILRPGSW